MSIDLNKESDKQKRPPRMFSAPFSFHGRIRRTEFGLSAIIYLIPCIILNVGLHLQEQPILFLLGFIPFYWFYLAQTAKRFHDCNMSAWYILVQCLPFVNILLFVLLIFHNGDCGENKYGADPKGR
jgi:uncharacterized membrane protein YhaH (DUF805 family)